MAKMIETFFGKMISAVSNETGEAYDDWRTKYIDWPGLIVIAESESKNPGQKFAYLYPNDPENVMQPFFHTSPGEYIRDNQYVTINTSNSRYVFEDCDFGICEEDKKLLLLNFIAEIGGL